MAKSHWMVRLVQIASVLFVLFGCFMVLLYSPFYSGWVVSALNSFVPVEVNQVAAKSQQMAALSEHENLEPGSKVWIARQAYLKLMEEAIQSHNSQDLVLIQARYKALQQTIEDAQIKEEQQQDKPQVPLLAKPVEAASEAEDPTQTVKDLLDLNSSENKALMEKYLDFLRTHEIEPEKVAGEAVDETIYQDIALIQEQNEQSQSQSSKPYAIVVLGGGLTLDKNSKDIVVNKYTRLRLEKTLEIERQYHLPIVLSGVEAPYMQRWLKAYNVDAKLLEDRSMNTCENSRFSSLLLQKKGGAPRVILITDRYHMPRTRRLFALNGIETVPVEAPMPTQLTHWRPSEQNYDHSRRANYEMLATIRDIWFGSSDCREVP
ncbi:YdcF family protein [Acinetobacter haemolyticus]|uniref:YdcF family protein n=1 Tax=unclassified Acinetobacter TaxID=196816 RepID=UPI0015D27AFD|nr:MULTISPECIES: YdcF family protein [unclassified Acinetobacter]UDM39585.1 YdcF family protein [Acinetobacter haemolyticus]